MNIPQLAFYAVMGLPLVSLLAPWPWVPRLWLASGLTFLFQEVGRAPNLDLSLSEIVGYGIIIAFLIFCLVLLWLRYLVTVWLVARRGRRFELLMKGGEALRWFDLLLFLSLGSILGLLGTSMLANAFEGAYRGYLTHVVVAVVCLAIVAFLVVWVRRSDRTLLRPWTVLLGMVLTIALASVLGIFQPRNVVASALELAEGRPHCILLLDRKQPPRSWDDLTFYAMDKRRRQHHAMLLVQGHTRIWPYHWSYRSQRFLPGIVNWDNYRRPKATCEPTGRFVEGLPLFNP